MLSLKESTKTCLSGYVTSVAELKSMSIPSLFVVIILLLYTLSFPSFRACAEMSPAATATVVATPAVKVCQLVGDFDRERNEPTRNLTMTRYKLARTDLGVPFKHKGRTYLLFGDTDGASGGDAIAYTTDASVENGISLTFPQDETGVYKPVFIPGISQAGYEVPMEGTSVGGKMYVYHTTDHSEKAVMGRSVVAVSEDDGITFNYLYDFSKRHFINVSIVEANPEDWPGVPKTGNTALFFFGSGTYRNSDVRLAVQPAHEIENPSSLCYFAGSDSAGQPMWSCLESDAQALLGQECVGELSVSYNRFIKRWIMLYNCDISKLSRIVMRTACFPWGPWSEPQIIFDPERDNGFCRFMHYRWASKKCDNISDPERENDSGGAYGPYQFKDHAVGNSRSTTFYFTMSTWNPYTVVLMKSTLTLSEK
jgi:hypothetical protein